CAQRKEITTVRRPEPAREFEMDAGRATSPSHGIGVAPDNKTLWVTSIPNNAVYVYSLADLKLVGHVMLPDLKLPGHQPISSVANWVTFTPDSKTIYISNASLRTVTAIDTQAMKVIATIPVGQNLPIRIVLGCELAAAGVVDAAAAFGRERMKQQPAGVGTPRIDELQYHLEVLARLLLGPARIAGRELLQTEIVVALRMADI